jgi:DNA-binding CsgD family transcriptional regulator
MPNYHYTEHFSLTEPYTSLVKDLTKDLYKNTDITFFAYIKATIDGASNILVSDSGLVKEWFQKGNRIFTGYNDEYKSAQTFSYYCAEKFPTDLIKMAREKFSLYNGISIVRRYKDYFELFGFADSNQSMDTSGRYMSYCSYLENYGNYFVKVGKDLINYAMQNPLPEKYALKEDKSIFLGNNTHRYKVRGLYGDTYLTPVEYISLQMILKGKSYKEIARVLAVSPKTIEKYLTSVRNKLGYNIRDILFVCEFEGKVHFSLCNSKLSRQKWV